MKGILRSDKDAWLALMKYIDDIFKLDRIDCAFKLFVNIILDHFLQSCSVKMSIRYKIQMYAKHTNREDFERKMLQLSDCLSVSENGFTYEEGMKIYKSTHAKLNCLKKIKKHAHLVGFCCLALKESLFRARERIFWSPGNVGYILASISFHSHNEHLLSRQRSRSPRRV